MPCWYDIANAGAAVTYKKRTQKHADTKWKEKFLRKITSFSAEILSNLP